MVSPGINWLIRRTPYFAGFTGVLYTAGKAPAPLWVSLPACVGLIPICLIGYSLYSDWVARRQAAKFGAVLPPQAFPNDPLGLQVIPRIKAFDEEYFADVLLRLVEDYGSGGIVLVNLLLERRVLTTEPEHIKTILATQFDNFHKGPLTFAELVSLLGQGVFNSDGDIWKFHRSMTRPFFNKERIAHFDVFERHAEDAIRQARDRLKSGHPIDFKDLVFRFTLDSASEFLFGQDVRSLSAELPYPNVPQTMNHTADIFADSFSLGQELTSARIRNGAVWPLMEFWKDKVAEHRRVVDNFVDPIITEALRKKKESAVAGAKDKDITEDVTLLDHLVNCTEDQKIIHDEALNILIAGRDTTATTLSFMVYMLAEHPEVRRKLRQEILGRVGPLNKPTFEDIREMKYLRAVINETLRLYPPVPINSRTSRRATTLPPTTPGGKPWFIPAGIKVGYSIFLMHRRKDLWGPDALLFDPDRFIDDRLHKYLIPNPFIFLPFNAGPRICLGQQFAYNEVSYFIIRFLQSFSDIEFVGSSAPPPGEWKGAEGPKGRDKILLRIHLTLHPKGHIWMRMNEAEKTDIDVNV